MCSHVQRLRRTRHGRLYHPWRVACWRYGTRDTEYSRRSFSRLYHSWRVGDTEYSRRSFGRLYHLWRVGDTEYVRRSFGRLYHPWRVGDTELEALLDRITVSPVARPQTSHGS